MTAQEQFKNDVITFVEEMAGPEYSFSKLEDEMIGIVEDTISEIAGME